MIIGFSRCSNALFGVFAALVCLPMVGCGKIGIPGSGNLVQADREVEAFTSVAVAGSGKLKVVAGAAEQKVTLETDDNLMEYVTTEVDRGELKIEFRETVSPSKGLDVTLHVASLSGVRLAGSYDAELESLDGTALSLKTSGSSEVVCRGKTEELSIESAGSGSFLCAELPASKVKIKIAGSGKAHVNASAELDVKIAGSGSVKYIGDPKVNQVISGSGSVSKGE